MSRPGLHDTVLWILEPLPRGQLLDIPAGEGALAARLVPLGFAVTCADLYPEIFRLDGVDIQRGDLDGTLPYPDGAFDYLTSLDGLEHIECPPNAVREFRRLLRSGGHLVVSVPNVLNIEERVKWLLHGYTSHFKPISSAALAKIREDYAGLDEIALHVNPIAYTELRYLLEKNGFQIQGVFRDRKKARIWLYWPLVALIRLIARLTPERKRRERWAEELQSDPVLLGGNTIILHAIRL